MLVVDDGSTDRTPELLRDFPTVRTIRHPRNLGYGAGLRTAFDAAIEGGLRRPGHARLRRPARARANPRDGGAAGGRRHRVGQPLPARCSTRPAAAGRAAADQRRSDALAERVPGHEPDRRVLRLQGVPDDRARAVDITDDGYAMPLQVWVQAVAQGMKIVEVAVPLIYLDESRAFGGCARRRRIPAEALSPGVPGGARSGRGSARREGCLG